MNLSGEFNLQVQQVNSLFAPEERDVYSYERTLEDLAPLGAKLGSDFACGRQSDCAPMELRNQERTAKL